MNKNLAKPFVLTLIVIAALLGLFFMPRLTLGDTQLRRVNILSDVQRKDAGGNIIAELKADSAEGIVVERIDSEAIRVEKPVYVDKVPEGMTAIEDFSDPEGLNREMDRFYAALDQAGKRVVRVAYFGDSYIEGDILTQDLRHLLQSRYGGKGVGFVDIMSLTSGFRQTVTQKSAGWQEHSASDKSGFKKNLQGFNGRYFFPSPGATMELKGQSRMFKGQLDTVSVATVYFTPSSGLDFSASVNGGEYSDMYASYDTLDTAGSDIVAKSVSGRIGRFSIKVNKGSNSRFYGVAVEGERGVTLDNLSMRGTSGWQLSYIPQPTLRRFAQLRPYDLIVLQYGLNVASPKTKDYSYYTKKMAAAIAHIKSAYPEASILVVSVGDRGQRNAQGEIHTMDGVRELVSFQRKMASDGRVAFWNLYEAMGGDGSIAAMKEKKQANLDYTHINFAGGKHIASILFDVLMNGKQNYDKRNQ